MNHYRSLVQPYSMPKLTTGQKLDHQDEQLRALEDLVRRMIEESGSGTYNNRRDSDRHPFARRVSLVPLDIRELKLLVPELAIARDVSRSGISLVSPRTFDRDALVVTLPKSAQKLRLMAEVVRVQPARLGLYVIGAKFVRRLEE